MSGVRAYHDTSVLTRTQSYGVQCTGGCDGSILSFRDNVLWAEDRIGHSADASDEGDNVYWRSSGRPRVLFPMDGSSRAEDPNLVDPLSGDLRPGPDSPLIDAGSWRAWDAGFWRDATGAPVPFGTRPDIGAVESTGVRP